MAGILCVVLAVLSFVQNTDAPGIVSAMNQPIEKEKFETAGSFEIKDGKAVFDFELTNHYSQSKELQFSSGQQFEVTITDEGGKEVYKFSDGKFFTQALIFKNIEPGESIKWRDSWSMTNKEGEKLTSGEFRAEINILASLKDDKEKIDKSQLTAIIDFNLIEQAAKQFIPQDAQFIIPVEPEGNNNFVEIDLDNDGTHETVVYYKDSDNTGLLILQQDENEWKLKDKIVSNSDNLEYAGFYDLDGDSKQEVLIGIKGHDKHKQLKAYKLQGTKYEHFYSLDYDSFSVEDLEGDGTLEIASIIRIDELIPFVKLQTHGLVDDSYKIEYEMDFEDGSYPDNVVIGAAREGRQGIFVDLGIGAHSGFTEILIKDNGEYKSALTYNKGDELPPTFKPYPLLCKDINNDGIIEVGIQQAPPETEDQNCREVETTFQGKALKSMRKCF